MIPGKPTNNKIPLATDPLVAWGVIGLGIGIGLGVIFDSLLVAAASGTLAGAAVGFYLKVPRNGPPENRW